MAKYKAFKKKENLPPQIKPGLPCVIIVLGGMILIGVVMFYSLKNAG